MFLQEFNHSIAGNQERHPRKGAYTYIRNTTREVIKLAKIPHRVVYNYKPKELRGVMPPKKHADLGAYTFARIANCT